LAASLAVAATIALAVPGVANAADSSVESASITDCATSTHATALENVTIRTSASTSGGYVTTAAKGTRWECFGVTLGGRYDACGHTNSNGWLWVRNGNFAGYTAMTCWVAS
jgi:hypothetical protein